MTLGACLASIAAHKACINVDKEALVSLEAKVKQTRKTASVNVCEPFKLEKQLTCSAET